MKILAAEDDDVLRTVLAHTLRKLGHEVVEAVNGEDAWARLQTTPFRIVVSDWMMPKVSGLELCQRIRARESADYVYFILLTVLDANEENKRKAADVGVDDFLVKPLNPTDLWLRLRVAERIIHCASRVRQLEELLPVCGYCKKVRNDQDYWQQIESYIREHTGAKLSHSICPDCYERVVIPQLKAAGIPPAPYSSPAARGRVHPPPP
jgi:sigma-B regulation protein RsbU (phosphoserine phosphatase)